MRASFKPRDTHFAERVRLSFERQPFMQTIGSRLIHVAPGEVDIELPFRSDLTQQHGFLHGGVVATICDTACGYAALTLMPADAAVLTVEYKINLVSPAISTEFVAIGRVTRPGQTVTVCTGDVYAVNDGKHEKLVATMLSTFMMIQNHEALRD